MQIFMKKFDNYLEYLFDLCYLGYSVCKLIYQFRGKSFIYNCNKLSVKNKIYLYIVFLEDNAPPLEIEVIGYWGHENISLVETCHKL